MMVEPAPLLDIPENPAPPGGAAEWVRGAGGARLRAALFLPPGPARGSIILSGGRTEPIEKYYEVIGECLDRGFAVLAHDWRGQGLSARDLPDRLKGHARGYKAFLDDYRLLLDQFEDRLPTPWVAMGHSMGGCLTLLALVEGETRIAGAILSAPMLGVSTGATPAGRARMMARLQTLVGRGGRYIQGDPGKPFDATFEGNVLTHDRRRFARNCALVAAHPDLALGAPTWGWLDFAFKATAVLARPEGLREVTVPVTIVSAEADKLVDNAAQAAAARHLPQGKFINVPGANHEILMETDEMRNIFLRAFDALTGRAAPKPAEAPKPLAAAAPVAQPPAPKPAAPAAAAPVAAASVAKRPAAAKKPAAKKPAARKPAAKPAAAKKPVAAKTPAAAKAPAVKPAAAKKPAAASKPAAAQKPAAGKKPAAAKKPAAKPAAAKKPAVAKPAKAPAAKKPAARPAAAKAPVARKPASKTPAAKKPTAKAPAAKPAAVKAAPKATAAKRTPAKKPAAKK